MRHDRFGHQALVRRQIKLLAERHLQMRYFLFQLCPLVFQNFIEMLEALLRKAGDGVRVDLLQLQLQLKKLQ